MTQDKLFAVYLGGRAPKCNTEIHDVVFVTGQTIEDTYEQLMDKWLGTPKGLHLDSWVKLSIVDGYKIGLSRTKGSNSKKLYFVNLGAYQDGAFTEVHANMFVVAENVPEAKKRGKSEMLKGWPGPVHTDDIYEVDSCIELDTVNAFYIKLEKTAEVAPLRPNNAYHIIPKAIVEDYMQRYDMEEIPNYRNEYVS